MKKQYAFTALAILLAPVPAMSESLEEQKAELQRQFDALANLFHDDTPYVSAERDKLPDGQWVFVPSPHDNQTLLAAKASSVSDTLDSAVMQIDCMRTDTGTELDVGFGYWLKGKAFPGDQYSLNLFHSSQSGRPAAYDLGDGEVSTAHIEGPSIFSDDPMPDAYYAEMGKFYAGLDAAKALRVTFSINATPGATYTADFPLDGLQQALNQIRRYCPLS